MVGWLDGWMVGWLDGWMVGWLEGWVVGWLEDLVVELLSRFVSKKCASNSNLLDFSRIKFYTPKEETSSCTFI